MNPERFSAMAFASTFSARQGPFIVAGQISNACLPGAPYKSLSPPGKLAYLEGELVSQLPVSHLLFAITLCGDLMVSPRGIDGEIACLYL